MTAALAAAARRRLDLRDVAYRWSAQNFHSPDGLPYIGKDHSGAYIATGFAADGLVYGSLAASVIADEVLGRGNSWSDLYKANRFVPTKAAKGLETSWDCPCHGSRFAPDGSVIAGPALRPLRVKRKHRTGESGVPALHRAHATRCRPVPLTLPSDRPRPLLQLRFACH